MTTDRAAEPEKRNMAIEWRDEAEATIRGAVEGDRRATLFAQALRVAALAKGRQLDEQESQRRLLDAALATGLPESEARATIGQAWAKATPREWQPDGRKRRRTRRRPAAAPKAPAEPPTRPRPDRERLRRFIRAQTVRVLDDAEACSWLRSRGLDPEAIETHRLARVLKPSCACPRWARLKGRRWSETHRLIVPLCGVGGEIESLHARALAPLPEGIPKGASPALGPGSLSGLAMANPAGRWLLGHRGAAADPFGGDGLSPFGDQQPRVIIAEGAPDFLSWASQYSDADADAPAVLAIGGGGWWTPELAAAIPDGARVVIATDHDKTGDKYATAIAKTLGRRVELRRWAQGGSDGPR